MRDFEVPYLSGCPNIVVLLHHLEAVWCGRAGVGLHEVHPAASVLDGFVGSPSVLIGGGR